MNSQPNKGHTQNFYAPGGGSGGVIAGQYGGTGVANTGKTITLGGNLTTSGAFATTLTATGTTTLTLPTTGTLATTTDLAARWAYNAPTAISAAGNTNLAYGAGQSTRFDKITVSAGSAAYLATITIQNTNAVAGYEFEALILMPASMNPTVELRNLTSGGTLLATITPAPLVRNWGVRFRYDGTNWSIVAMGVLRGASIDEVNERVNARSARGGLAFDGTSGARVAAPMGVPGSIGTDSCSVVQTIEIPSVNPPNSRGLWYFSSSSASSNVARSLYAEMKTSGEIVVYQLGATTADQRVKTYLGIVSRFAGKRVIFCYVRSVLTNTFNLYANGDLLTGTETTTGTPPAWSDTITTSYFVMGNNASSSEAWSGCIYSASLYNLALSQSDITEIHELGGAVPERFKTGNQAGQLTGNDTNFASGLGSWITFGAWNVLSNPSANLRMTVTAAATNDLARPNTLSAAISKGKIYRVRLTSTLISGAVASLRIKGASYAFNPFSGAALSFVPSGAPTTVTFDNLICDTSGQIAVGKTSGSSETFVADIDDFQLTQIGAVAHYDFDQDGIGYQAHDQLANKLDAVLTTTGVTWTKPQRRGYVRGTLSWAGTHEAKSLLGQRCLPTDAIIEDFTLKPTAVSTGSGARLLDQPDSISFLTAFALTTARKRLNGPAFNMQQPNATTDAASNVGLDPDTVAYTGSIEYLLNYSIGPTL